MYGVWCVSGCVLVCAGVCVCIVCGLRMYTCGVWASLMNNLFRFLLTWNEKLAAGRDQGLRPGAEGAHLALEAG